ncbi:MAG: hypothetical protein NTX49_00460 [Chlamydiae bacterium]|nr:hypothetical protein [Chlamydiota bacterium]
MLKAISKPLLHSVSELCFPTLCISCAEPSQGFLCAHCRENIELIDLSTRCPICFIEQEGLCFACKKRKAAPRAAVCEGYGPARSLVAHLSESKIQKNIGSLMLVQLCRLPWPLPDILLPVSMGGDDATGIARQVSSFIAKEVSCCIKTSKYSIDEGLLKKERFSLKKTCNLSDKNCLVVTVHALNEEQRSSLSDLLVETDPKGIYFLSFISSNF